MLFKLILLLFILHKVFSDSDIPCAKAIKEYGYVCVCNATYCDTINRPKRLDQGEFHVYSTSYYNPGFNHYTSKFSLNAFNPNAIRYTVNKNKKRQTVRGFGGTFTDSFGINLDLVSEEVQDKIIRSFFAKDGIEFTTCRIVLGSSDFGLNNYTYAPTYDPTLKSFNLTKFDYKYKIKPIKKALSVSENHLNFMGSTWFCPYWMLLKNRKLVGRLKPEFRQVWADYYVKTLDAFKAEGIDFWTLTTGNEPITLYAARAMRTLVMFPEDQRDWIIDNLGPSLRKANYSTKIVVMDDMRIQLVWWMDIMMREKRIQEYILGIGIHFYTDFITSLNVSDIVHMKYPSQEIIYSEASMNILMAAVDDPHNRPQNQSDPSTLIGPKLGSWKRASYYAVNLIENLSHWMTTFIDWNLGLNGTGGPNINLPCDAPIIVNDKNGEFYKEPMFYVLGLFSKFIKPNSSIIDVQQESLYGYYYFEDEQLETRDNKPSNKNLVPMPPLPTLPPLSQDVQYIAALNMDGSTTVIFYNPKTEPVAVELYDKDRGNANLVLEQRSVNALHYW